MILKAVNPVKTSVIAVAVVFGLAGCAVIPPSYPTVMALPAKGKSISEFQQEDYSCRAYASQVVNPMANAHQVATSGVAGPAIGAAGGAVAGALIGAGAGNAGVGAAIGAGAGLLLGSAQGLGIHNGTEASLQRQYDNSYAQCITAKGNTIELPAPAPVVTVAPPVIYAPPVYYYVY